MTKYLRILILAMLVVGLMASGVMAGTLSTSTRSTTYKMALEMLRGTAATVLTDNLTDNTVNRDMLDNMTYTPSDIPLGTLSDALFTLTLSDNATWDNLTFGSGAGPDNLTICDSSGNVIARYKTGRGSSVLQFDKAGNYAAADQGTGSVTNGLTYSLRVDDNGTLNCLHLDNRTGGSGVDGARIVKIAVPRAATTINIKWAAGIATTQTNYDCATTALIATTTQLSAARTASFDANLDASNSFKKFYENNAAATFDNATFTVTIAPIVLGTLDKGITFAATDNLSATVTFTALDNSSLDNVTLDNITNGVVTVSQAAGGGVCSVNGDTDTATCTYTNGATAMTAGATNIYKIVATGSGSQTNAIRESTMTLGLVANLTNGQATTLLTGTSLGQWINNGYVAIVPYVSTDSAYRDICIINNGNSTPTSGANVYVKILTTEGTAIAGSMTIGTVAAGKTARLDFNGTNISIDEGTATDISAMGASKRYSAQVTVGSNADNVTMTCVQTDPAGPKRAVPVLTDASLNAAGTAIIGPKWKN